jgi:hypothetical protein
MVPMIDNPQQGTVNLGVGLFPYLMGTFDFPPPSNDVKFISVVPDQPKVVILQVDFILNDLFRRSMDFTFPIDFDGRGRESWHGYALIHN